MIEQDWKLAVLDRMEFLGISRRDLAVRMNVSPQFVTNYLNDSRGIQPGPRVMERFATALGMRVHLTLEVVEPTEHD